jgi:hypothetical protein
METSGGTGWALIVPQRTEKAIINAKQHLKHKPFIEKPPYFNLQSLGSMQYLRQ